MSFTTKENREKMLKFLETGKMPEKLAGTWVPDIAVGDWCFVYYRSMILLWKESSRWTTAHNIYKKMCQDVAILRRDQSLDKAAAYELAWQVFFNLHVIPYELKKREENGEVEE